MKSKAGKIVTLACFTFIAIAFIKCSIAMADKSGMYSPFFVPLRSPNNILVEYSKLNSRF